MNHEAAGSTLALVNAILNATSAVLMLLGRTAIAKQHRETHRKLMVGAFLTSTLFLCSYLTRVALTGTHKDPHTGLFHVAYLVVLLSHMTLAIAVVPLVLRTLFLARSARFTEHKKIAKITYPVWLYVSVTGVVVYVMLYVVPA